VLGLDVGEAALLAPREGDLASRLDAAFAGRARAEVLDALVAAGVAAAPVLRSAESLEDPWLAENGFYEPWNHPRLGPMMTVRGYADFARTPGGLYRPTPEPGEHTREILREYGVAEDRIRQLFEGGAAFEWAGAEAVAAT
jgi:crotonobetainyl-CoA:carnitine CoA-transferase CaiB-like acyl-CoA transferase